MKSIFITVFLVGNLVPGHFGGDSQTRAFLTNIKGTIKIQSRGKAEAKAEADAALLYDGDIIKVGDNGEALLWQAYSKILRLEPKTSKVISKLPPSSEPDVLSFNDYLKNETEILDFIRDTRRPSPRKQGGNSEQYFIALAPRFSLALSLRPTFEWTSLKDATSYDFALYDADQNLIFEKNTKESHLTYPDQKADLKPGKYRWEVFAIIDRGTKKYDATEFTIVTAEEAAKIQTALAKARKLVQESAATNLIYMTVCFEYQQYPEAEKALKAALSDNPDNQILKALLMQAYERMNRPDEREDLRSAFESSDLIEVSRKLRIAEFFLEKK